MSTLSWQKEAATWPNATASRFVEAGGHRWHVQIMGQGPDVLLLHGTGASTHSWRDFAPLLAKQFRVIAPDLPGHGFTQAPPSRALSLPAVAGSVSALLQALDVTPAMAIGHSAGAAILCRMTLDQAIRPASLISLNGALLPFKGVASTLFPALARLMFVNPIVPSFLSWRATNKDTVRNLIADTGSHLDAQGLALYGRLFQSSAHVAAALNMMANWDLNSLTGQLQHLPTPPIFTLIATTGDIAIPADAAFKVKDLVPAARVVLIRGLGHLAHEEKPHEIARAVFQAAAQAGLSGDVQASLEKDPCS